MSKNQLMDFLTKYKMSHNDLADLLGLTHTAVDHWLQGRRSIAKPYGRILRMFDRRPDLMKEFK